MSIKTFLFGKNDWRLTWQDEAEFEVANIIGVVGWTVATCYYEIYFSPSRNRYKLKLSGFPHGKEHSKYQAAKDMLSHFESQL